MSKKLLVLLSVILCNVSNVHAGKVVLNCIEQHSQTQAYVYAAEDDEDKNMNIIAFELGRSAGKRNDDNSFVEYKLNCDANFEITIKVKHKEGDNK